MYARDVTNDVVWGSDCDCVESDCEPCGVGGI